MEGLMMTVDQRAIERCFEAHQMISALIEGSKLDYADAMSVLTKLICDLTVDELEPFLAKMEVCYVFYKCSETNERTH
jgi:hypothetical protein